MRILWNPAVLCPSTWCDTLQGLIPPILEKQLLWKRLVAMIGFKNNIFKEDIREVMASWLEEVMEIQIEVHSITMSFHPCKHHAWNNGIQKLFCNPSLMQKPVRYCREFWGGYIHSFFFGPVKRRSSIPWIPSCKSFVPMYYGNTKVKSKSLFLFLWSVIVKKNIFW